MFGHKQLKELSTNVSHSNSNIINYTLESFIKKDWLQDCINVGPSDPQVINCTRKIARIKREKKHKQIRHPSLKDQSADI